MTKTPLLVIVFPIVDWVPRIQDVFGGSVWTGIIYQFWRVVWMKPVLTLAQIWKPVVDADLGTREVAPVEFVSRKRSRIHPTKCAVKEATFSSVQGTQVFEPASVEEHAFELHSSDEVSYEVLSVEGAVGVSVVAPE